MTGYETRAANDTYNFKVIDRSNGQTYTTINDITSASATFSGDVWSPVNKLQIHTAHCNMLIKSKKGDSYDIDVFHNFPDGRGAPTDIMESLTTKLTYADLSTQTVTRNWTWKGEFGAAVSATLKNGNYSTAWNFLNKTTNNNFTYTDPKTNQRITVTDVFSGVGHSFVLNADGTIDSLSMYGTVNGRRAIYTFKISAGQLILVSRT